MHEQREQQPQEQLQHGLQRKQPQKQHPFEYQRARQREIRQGQLPEVESDSDPGDASEGSGFELGATPKRAKLSPCTAEDAKHVMRSIRDDPWWQLPVANVKLHSAVEQFGYVDSDSDHGSCEQTWMHETCSTADAAHERTPRVTSLLDAAEGVHDVTTPQPESEPGPDLARLHSCHREPCKQEAKRQRNG